MVAKKANILKDYIDKKKKKPNKPPDSGLREGITIEP